MLKSWLNFSLMLIVKHGRTEINWDCIVKQKELDCKGLEDSQLTHIAKSKKASSGENTKHVARHCLLKRLWVCDLWIQSIISVKMLPTWTQRNRKVKMKELCQTSEILQAGNRLIELSSCGHRLRVGPLSWFQKAKPPFQFQRAAPLFRIKDSGPPSYWA